MSKNLYLAAWSHLQSLGPARFRRIESGFSSLEAAWHAHATQLIKCGIEEKTALRWADQKKTVDISQIQNALDKNNITLLSWHDPDYPPLLKELHNPPPWIYIRGNKECLSHTKTIGVVGTRKVTVYGRRATEHITTGLVRSGVTIASGLAYGVDETAHKATLDHGGTTVAVLASGLDDKHIFSNTRSALARRILTSDGLLLSEYPPGMPALRHHFPYRNRIISGLSRGVLIVEAPEGSGALITASDALEQNREVFAVPGDLFHPHNHGPHSLIKQGAGLVTDAADILEVFEFTPTSPQKKPETLLQTDEEKLLWQHLSFRPTHIDELARAVGKPSHEISATLSLMEIQGSIQNLGGLNYVRRQ